LAQGVDRRPVGGGQEQSRGPASSAAGMVQRGLCPLVAGACLLCRLVRSPGGHSLRGLAFASAPGSYGLLRTARGVGHPSAPSSPSEAPAQSSVEAGASAWAAAAAAAALGVAARHGRKSPKPRCSRVACAGKKRGGGGGGGQGGGDGSGEQAEDVDTEAIIKEYSSKMDTTISLLRENLATIRAGRATPALLDPIKVNAYDSQVAVKEVGTITVQDATTLLVCCFDETVVPSVEKAIVSASLGYSVQVAGPNVKVGIPTMTKEKRAQYAKMAKDFAEKSRVAVRNVRQAALKKVKGISKKVSEDVVKSMQDEVEAMVKKNIGECDKIFKAKETEIMKG